MGVSRWQTNCKENEQKTESICTNNYKPPESESEGKTPHNVLSSISLRTSLTPTAMRVPRIRMSNGKEIPAVGLGTSTSVSGEVKQAVKDAIDAGYRHIDCAFSRLNETEIGEAVREKMSDGVVRRGDLFIVSRVWNTFHHPEQVELGLRKSLEALNLDYVDLYLIHWPTEFQQGGTRFPILTRDETNGKILFNDVDICDTWKAMEQLVQQGLAKSIGVSNFNTSQLVRLLSGATIRPAVNQIEIHPFIRKQELLQFCKDNDIVVTAYSPLKSTDCHWETEPTFLHVPKLLHISRKYNKSMAQVVLRWAIQRGIVVVPKSVNKGRIRENLNVFDFYLTEHDMDNIFGGESWRSRSYTM